MNFETDYKNIHFKISAELETYADVTLVMGDKFNRLPNQTMIEIKKGAIAPYNIIITSLKDEVEYTHYLSGILLTTDSEEILDELGQYLDQENILDDIAAQREKYEISPGPAWR